ncbi:MAG: bifunctional precorrin-2 dehydrogenase/sirohydrochlorin ferrochelatase [Desulfotignum sp.]|nr:bifunctional precorrin-2 dehydrogenase/sirohydrochlorin ferrochelatase [Desulfobacteraceae bacterium]
MKYYPVFLDTRGRNCLVVGGGRVGTRKAKTLVRSGAYVTVVSKKMCEALEKLPGIVVKRRAFHPGDLEGMFLVFAATNDAGLNQQVLTDARAVRVLCNSADAPGQGDFILPAVMEQGDLICAVSTCGASPVLAKKIRDDLAQAYGPEYAMFLLLMKAIRKKLLAAGHDPQGHKMIFRALMEKNLPALIAAKDFAAIDTALFELLGNGFDSTDLISQKL